MDLLISGAQHLIFFFQHIPDHLQAWAADYGRGFYLILALIVFAETGLIVTPFLPGDSLLFAAGALIALELPGIDIYTMALVLTAAAVLGDLVNYHVGKWLGPRLFRSESARILNPKHLERTREFYARYGGKTIILARFAPIVRTYAPFVAGMGAMNYATFFVYNLIGGAVWVTAFLGLGFFFGNMPSIKSNFQYVILAIIVLSVLPMVFEYVKARRVSPAKNLDV